VGWFCTILGIYWWDSRQYEVLAVMAFCNWKGGVNFAMMAFRRKGALMYQRVRYYG